MNNTTGTYQLSKRFNKESMLVDKVCNAIYPSLWKAVKLNKLSNFDKEDMMTTSVLFEQSISHIFEKSPPPEYSKTYCVKKVHLIVHKLSLISHPSTLQIKFVIATVVPMKVELVDEEFTKCNIKLQFNVM